MWDLQYRSKTLCLSTLMTEWKEYVATARRSACDVTVSMDVRRWKWTSITRIKTWQVWWPLRPATQPQSRMSMPSVTSPYRRSVLTTVSICTTPYFSSPSCSWAVILGDLALSVNMFLHFCPSRPHLCKTNLATGYNLWLTLSLKFASQGEQV